jgi:hypothetical protein
MNTAQLELSIPAVQLDQLGIGIEVDLRIDPRRISLPEGYEANPDQAISQMVARDRGRIEMAHMSSRSETGEVLAGLAVVALKASNPMAAFKKAVEGVGLPLGEAVEHFRAWVYSSNPKLAPYLIGLVTSTQINGQVRGNPEVRKQLEQALLTDGRPTRKAAQAIDLGNVTERKATRQHSGDTLEAQVQQMLDWAGLAYQRRRPQPILKMFGERAEPDFTVTDGIDDAHGILREGFYIECKNRPVGRIPDTDLIYALESICMFYPKTTIVVLETPVDRIREAVTLFMDHHRKQKRLGNLRAVLSMDEFRGLVQDQIGRAA